MPRKAKAETKQQTAEVVQIATPKKKIIKIEKTKGDATLIITEKPQAAMKIAAALSDGKDKKYSDNGIPFYEFEHNGKKFIVGCAVGHLFGIGQKEGTRGTFPAFDVVWRPNYVTKGAAFTKKYYDLLQKLAKRSNDFIIATDYDNEGEVIGWNVLRFLAKQQDAKRMKFSSLTKDELQNAFEHASPHLNWGQAIAGETRHYIDWFYGINLSRGLMKALSKTGKFRILSIGRVQGPALALVVDREMEIKNFKPTPFWQVFLHIKDLNKQQVEVKFPSDITKELELQKFKHLKGKKALAKTEIKEEQITPPTPFDLTTLQTEAFGHLGITPSQTLQIAQKLYLDGLISYPRTSSQQYPEAIGYDKIMKALGKQTQLTKYAANKKPTEGKKTDPAHPAIYPTGEIKRDLEGREKKIYELIMRRFISCFCLPAIVETKRITAEVDGMIFSANGLVIKEKNWMQVYPSRTKENKIPTINGEVSITEVRIEEKETQPPKRYSQASLIKELEKRNLGTKSTRANIIDTLTLRGYIQGTSIEATPLGIRMEKTLAKYSPIILDKELTREMDEEMEKMVENQGNGEASGNRVGLLSNEGKIIDEAKKAIIKIAADITKNMDKIGAELADASDELREGEKQENTLTLCPVCKKGNLRIMYGRAYKRYFISCSNYPECKNKYSLPPYGMMKPAKKAKKDMPEEEQEENDKNKKGKTENQDRNDLELCPECHFPLMLAIQKGKRPWKFCFNPLCPSRKRQEEYKKEHPKKRSEKQEEEDEERKKIAMKDEE